MGGGGCGSENWACGCQAEEVEDCRPFPRKRTHAPDDDSDEDCGDAGCQPLFRCPTTLCFLYVQACSRLHKYIPEEYTPSYHRFLLWDVSIHVGTDKRPRGMVRCAHLWISATLCYFTLLCARGYRGLPPDKSWGHGCFSRCRNGPPPAGAKPGGGKSRARDSFDDLESTFEDRSAKRSRSRSHSRP